MADKNFFQKFTSLYTDKSINGWVRGFMFVGTGIVIYAVGRTAYNKIFPNEAAKAAQLAGANLDNSINKNQSDGVKPTYPLPNYDSYADTIYNALNIITGDEYSSASDTLCMMQNNLDVELLIKAFGTRPAHTKLQSVWESPMGLFAFVNTAFDARWFGLWNQDKNKVNSDWESKGITYRL
jgi:hypothetical protein